MNPANFFRKESTRGGVINGPRPTPLRINKDSHAIQKPPSMKATKQQNPKWNQPRQPVIIYTHSPKIIHTKPKDFMSLVQRLTGFTRSDQDRIVRDESQKNIDQSTSFEEKNVSDHEDNDSSSVTSDEKYEGGNASGDAIKERKSAVSPINQGLNPYLQDFPLFTPNSNVLFASPQSVFRYPHQDLVFTSPNIVSSLSPSFIEFMKGLPEY